MMDRALKERIIGAAVLVLVVVLVVPVFLDGPPEEADIVTERVPLPGQSDQETRTVVLERDRSTPVPTNGSAQPAAAQSVVESEPAAAQPVAGPAPAMTRPAPQPVPQTPPADEPEPEPEAANQSATGMWAVQLGSFSNQQNAERLAADLRKQNHAAFLSQVATANGLLYRVRIGPQKDRASAEAVAAQLRAEGHDVKVLPHP